MSPHLSVQRGVRAGPLNLVVLTAFRAFLIYSTHRARNFALLDLGVLVFTVLALILTFCVLARCQSRAKCSFQSFVKVCQITTTSTVYRYLRLLSFLSLRFVLLVFLLTRFFLIPPRPHLFELRALYLRTNLFENRKCKRSSSQF